MRGTAFRRMALPPSVVETLGPAERRERGRAVATVIASSIAIDVLIVLVFRGAPYIRQSALVAFAWINIPLLTIDLALALTLRSRPGKALVWAEGLGALIEVFTVLVWVQLTGIVSSYFLLVGPLLIVSYRRSGGYWVALWGTACLATLHAGALVLEDVGVLRPAALFVERPDGLYAARLYRYVSLLSIEWVYVFVFTAANFVATVLREKDVALDAARRDVERAVEEAQPGRLVGSTLAGYALGELLGRGGMGEVYQGTRKEDGRAVAVKVLYRQHGAPRESLARFKREVEACRRLPRTHVAEVFDSGETPDGLSYLVMELLRGEDLSALLRRRERLPLEEAVPIVEALAAVLDAAHAAGIVHRDVKPQNIFLSSAPNGGALEVRLLDFGIARLMELDEGRTLTMTSAIVGTPGYLAPEQISAGFGEVGPATDVFALGAVAYRMLTGVAAFDTRHVAAALHAALNEQPANPSAIAPWLSADVDCVLALALAKRPRHRYASAGELAADLRAVLRGALGESTRARAREFARFASEVLPQTMAAPVGEVAVR